MILTMIWKKINREQTFSIFFIENLIKNSYIKKSLKMSLKPYKVDLNCFKKTKTFCNPVSGNSKFTKRARLLFRSDFEGNTRLGGKIYHHQAALVVRLWYKHRFKGRKPSNWEIVTKM